MYPSRSCSHYRLSGPMVVLASAVPAFAVSRPAASANPTTRSRARIKPAPCLSQPWVAPASRPAGFRGFQRKRVNAPLAPVRREANTSINSHRQPRPAACSPIASTLLGSTSRTASKPPCAPCAAASPNHHGRDHQIKPGGSGPTPAIGHPRNRVESLLIGPDPNSRSNPSDHANPRYC